MKMFLIIAAVAAVIFVTMLMAGKFHSFQACLFTEDAEPTPTGTVLPDDGKGYRYLPPVGAILKGDYPKYWTVASPDFEKSVVHNNPYEIELYFMGNDGSEWKAVKWEKVQ